MTSWLTERAFANGATCVFLTAYAEPEARIYARAGFTRRSEARRGSPDLAALAVGT